jgi:hypothetical protein
MATTQTAISASSVASTPVGVNQARRLLYIRNYSSSAATMWVAFGKTATAGTAGELEIIAGGEYLFGGRLPPSVGNLPLGTTLIPCPTESISVITSSSTATGCIMEIS